MNYLIFNLHVVIKLNLHDYRSDEMESSHDELEGDRSIQLCSWTVQEIANFVGKMFGPKVAKCFEG